MGMEPIEGKIISIKPKRNQGLNLDHCNMVGIVITEKEIKFKICKNVLLGMWGNSEGVAIFEKISSTYKDGHRGDALEEINHDFMAFWIQVHGVPEENMNLEVVSEIVDLIGIVKEVDDPVIDNTLMRKVLRFKTTIDISRPLQTGFWLSRDPI
ncbi:hypothetical protein AHAS_Ahas17G0122700 [Arachis hypogaea]